MRRIKSILKRVCFKNGDTKLERAKVEIKPISNRKFKQLKKIQKNRMVYEDYSYLNAFGGKF